MQIEEGEADVSKGGLCNWTGCGVGRSGCGARLCQVWGVGGQPLCHSWAATTFCSSNPPMGSCTEVRSDRKTWFYRLKKIQDSKRGATLERAGLLVCTCLCNAACASGSYVGLWLLHSSPAVQELWGMSESKVTSKDTYFLLGSFGPWACKKA